MKELISVIFLLVSFCNIFAQDHLLSSFRAVQTESGIKLSFTLWAGIQCNDLEIQRSPDDVNFEEIGIIPGICGSTSTNESYEFTDIAPLINKIAYYRLNLRNEGYSFSIKIKYINYNEDGYLLYPNPFSNETNIYLKNNKNSEYSLVIYDKQGRMVMNENTNSNLINIKRNSLGSGVFLFQLVSDEEVKATGRFVIN